MLLAMNDILVTAGGGLWRPHTHWRGWYDVPSETSLSKWLFQSKVPIQIIITIIWKTKDSEEECVITSPANVNVLFIVLLMIFHNPSVPYVIISVHTLQWWEMSTMGGRLERRRPPRWWRWRRERVIVIHYYFYYIMRTLLALWSSMSRMKFKDLYKLYRFAPSINSSIMSTATRPTLAHWWSFTWV